MNKDEVVKTLLTRAKIDPGFTTLGKHLYVSVMPFIYCISIIKNLLSINIIHVIH
jgi:hypothetical protein